MAHSCCHPEGSALHGQHEAGQAVVVPAVDVDLGVLQQGQNLQQEEKDVVFTIKE